MKCFQEAGWLTGYLLMRVMAALTFLSKLSWDTESFVNLRWTFTFTHSHVWHMHWTYIMPFCFPKLIYLTVSLTVSLSFVYSSWEKLKYWTRETAQCPWLCCGHLIEKVTWKAQWGWGIDDPWDAPLFLRPYPVPTPGVQARWYRYSPSLWGTPRSVLWCTSSGPHE